MNGGKQGARSASVFTLVMRAVISAIFTRRFWRSVSSPDSNTSMASTAPIGPCSIGYVEETLVPALRPGDTVVLDNLPAHKVSGIRERIEAAGARLLTCRPIPPTSTRSILRQAQDEVAFAKLKAILRAEEARTISDLWDTIRQAFRRFTPAECRRYLAAAVYDAYDLT